MPSDNAKADFPVAKARRYLEPGPVVLISSAWQGETNIMTLGWHTVLEFVPSTIGCMISAGNHSFELIRSSGACVVNVPTAELIDAVIGIGNTSGREIDKFDRFGLTPEPAQTVDAPAVGECHASFECRLSDDGFVGRHNFFVFEIVAARVRPQPAYPKTLHYTGDGVFMIAGETVDRSAQFRPEML